jgi:hypothetical protein
MISAGLDEALARFRQKLLIDPEDPRSGLKWYRKTVDQARDQQARPGTRWAGPVRWWLPAPMDGRPVSSIGRTTFYLDHATATRAATGTKVVSSNGNVRLVSVNGAAEHHRYINESAHPCEAEMHSAYIRVRPDRMEEVSRTATAARQMYRGASTATFNNIHADPEAVAKYWRWIHRTASVPGPNKIRPRPDLLSPQEWRDLGQRWALHPDVEQILLAAASTAAGRQTEEDRRRIKKGLILDPETIERLIEDAATLPSWNKKKRAIFVSEGRGGRTQERLVIELPAELPLDRQINVAEDICDYLSSLGFFLEASLHVPDHDNDRRNFHLHINYHERAGVYDEATGKWQDLPRQAGKRGRPKRSNVTATRSKDGFFLREGADFMRGLRRKVAELVNNELILNGRVPRYDPRPYPEMGIDQEPSEHLGNDAAKIAITGSAVAADIRNAERSWNAERGRRMRRLEKERQARADAIALGEATVATIDWRDAMRSFVAADLRRLREAAAAAQAIEEKVEEARFYRDLADSRAARTERTALRILAAIESGTAARAEVRECAAIAARLEESRTHRSEVATIYAPVQPLEEQLEAHRRVIDTAIAAIFSFVRRQEQRQAAASEGKTAPKPPLRLTGEERFAELERIWRKNLIILADEKGRISPSSILGVTPAEHAFLSENWASVGARLRKRFEYQEMKVGRLREFRKHHPNSWGALLRGAPQDEAVPKAIVTMFERYRAHPEVDPAGATSPLSEPRDLNDPEAPRLYDTEPIRVPAAATKKLTRPPENRELVDVLEAEELAADAPVPAVKQHAELERVEAAAPPPPDVSAEPLADPPRAAGEDEPRVSARTIPNVSHGTAEVNAERSEAAEARQRSALRGAIPGAAVAPASAAAKRSTPVSAEGPIDPRLIELADPRGEIASAMAALVENHADSLLLSPDERRSLRGCLGEPQTVFAALHYGRFPCLCTDEPVLAACLVALSKMPEADAFIDALHDLAVSRGLGPFRGAHIPLPPMLGGGAAVRETERDW